ncbi:MAG: hypothetical protein KA109_18770 [Saprospiraceae bacterium]|jgi:hypothetical protein|nr:hypothetical protein [Saprospiraceae bacterium]MBK6814631.1 hypothetical protein [Saprospiraceae bacterium]MBK7437722.1 hypothetical protein [Saprospiraceae bacterium]MBK8279092.1 hypothetical protein [Saprospiraceae bacterium]MBK9678873.1 hypothetical protein [Saprospiraceae bacterium]
MTNYIKIGTIIVFALVCQSFEAEPVNPCYEKYVDEVTEIYVTGTLTGLWNPIAGVASIVVRLSFAKERYDDCLNQNYPVN